MKTLSVLFMMVFAISSYSQDAVAADPQEPITKQLGDVQVEIVQATIQLEKPSIVPVLVDSEGNVITDLSSGIAGTVRMDTITERVVAQYNLFYRNDEGEKIYITALKIQ